MIIAVDFDGTLHTGKWPSLGAPAPYAVETMQKFREDKHYLIVWTCREGQQLTEAINWLLEHKIPFDRINDNNPENTRRYGSNSRKIYAHLYVEDKQVGGLPMWNEIYDYATRLEGEYLNSKVV